MKTLWMIFLEFYRLCSAAWNQKSKNINKVSKYKSITKYIKNTV